MSLLAIFEETGGRSERRARTRRTLRLAATANHAESRESAATIHDLSESGMLLETSASLGPGEQFQIFLPLAGPVDTVVVWNSGNFYGCQFGDAVPTAAVSAALLKSVPGNAEAASVADRDLLAHLHDLNVQVEQMGRQLDGTIEELQSERNAARPRDPAAELSSLLWTASSEPPQAGEPLELGPDLYPEPETVSDGDAGRLVVIFMLALAGIAVLIFAAALLGAPL
jgi:hypothetical protein